MFGPDDLDAATVRPPTPGAGTPGWFQEGDLALRRWPTKVRAWFLNMLLEELRALISFAGLTEDKAYDGQVLEAVQRIARATGPRWVRDTPGDHAWTCPAGVYSVTPRFQAGGGAGAAGTTTAPGHGGGGGAYAEDAVGVVPGTEYLVSIGSDGGIVGFGLIVPPGGAATGARPGGGGNPSGGTDHAVLMPGGGGGYGLVAGGVVFGGGGGASRLYGSNGSVNNGGLPADQAVPGQGGLSGQGGSGGPNGSGGPGGKPQAELHY